MREVLIEGPVSTPNSNLSPMRIHELALLYWCHRNFLVKDGYPVPVVFSKPMDAFGHFQDLWKQAENPFSYLLALRDENGTPLYEPDPSPARYPLISINRRKESYRPSGNFSIHRRRTVSWPTASDDVDRQDLAGVRVRNRPMGINFHLDITFWCLRPDTQAVFMQRVWNCFWRSGGSPQTWIPVVFPTEDGKLQVRMALEGDVNDSTQDSGSEQTRYQTNLSVRIEGYQVDMRDTVLPAFWATTLRTNLIGLDPSLVINLYSETVEHRDNVRNPNILQREGVPAPREEVLFWNVEQASPPCPAGTTGDIVTIPAHTHSSPVSQEVADTLARDAAAAQQVCVVNP